MVETATFALGCFWGPDDYFSKLPGVVRTRVGYSGGSTENPTYTYLGDHTETIEIEFDPSIISYEELLNHFFKKHNAGIVQSTQYKSAIFTHNEKQYMLAKKRKNQEQEKTGKHIMTIIAKALTFYEAEKYHQKYLAKVRSKNRE